MVSHEQTKAEESVRLGSIATGTWIVFTARGLGKGLQVAVEVVLARVLGPVAFGTYGVAWAIVKVASSIGKIGLDQGGLRNLAAGRAGSTSDHRETLTAALGGAAITSGFVCVLVFLKAPWLADVAFHDAALSRPLRIMTLSVPVGAVTMVGATMTRYRGRMLHSVLGPEIVRPVVQGGVFLLLVALAAQSLFAASVSVLAGYLCAMGVTTFGIRTTFPGVVRQGLKWPKDPTPLFRVSLPLAAAGIVGLLLNWTDSLMLAFFKTPSDVGFYRAASQLSLGLSMPLPAIGAALSPKLAYLHRRDGRSALSALYRVSSRWPLYAIMPGFLVLLFGGHAVLVILYGGEYGQAQTALIVLSCGQLINALTGSAGTMLAMTGRERAWSVCVGGAAVLNVILNLVLVPTYGYVGASIATAVAVATTFVLAAAIVVRHVGAGPIGIGHLQFVVAAVFAGGAVAVLALANLSLGPWLWICLVVAAIGAGSLIGVSVQKEIHGQVYEEDRALLQGLLRPATKVMN